MIKIGTNAKVFGDSLAQAYQHLGNLTELMQGIGLEMEARINERFETRSDPSGKPWAVWADATRKQYPANGNKKILDRYGDMLASLSLQADASSVRIGFGTPYAAYHEWGTKHMPRRGTLFDNPDAGTLTEDDSTAILEIISDFLTEI